MSSFYRGAKHVSGPLFDLHPKAPSIPGSETSEKAARSIEPSSESLRGRVFRCIQLFMKAAPEYQGATDEQIQDWLEMDPSTERPRRIELVNLGLVRDSGRKRRTRSGREAVVWIAV